MTKSIFILFFFLSFRFVVADELTKFEELLIARNCLEIESYISDSDDPDYYLGILYEVGVCRNKDIMLSLDSYRKSAKLGSSHSMYAFFVLVGRLPSPEVHKAELQTDELMTEAKGWLIKAGNLGYVDAATVLTSFYELGAFGFPKDDQKSKFYRDMLEKYNSTQKK